VPGEGRVRSSKPDEARPTQPPQSSSVSLRLIAAPDIPEKIANQLVPDLPKLLREHLDNRLYWDVSVVVDPLTGTEREAPEILDVCHERLEQEGWDLALCLTDLPVYRSGRLVVADVSAQRKVAGLSLPVVGAIRLLARVREAAYGYRKRRRQEANKAEDGTAEE
jgi:hypothetical protein